MLRFYSTLLRFLLKLLCALPLPLIHVLGVGLGWAACVVSRHSFLLLRENLRHSGIAADGKAFRRILYRNIGESGKAVLETFAIWQKPLGTTLAWVRRCDGWEHVEAAQARGKGIIFLTPHLGCYEIASLYYAASQPITILYRPPKQKWIQPLIEAGRVRGKASLAPATGQGVRELLLALKRGEAVGILPDQIPYKGEGEWANYFGRPAYTMTLASRLAEKTGATVIMAFGERLSFGRGYHLHLTPLTEGSINTVAGLNAAIESQVRQCPEQYLWNYHRHRISRRAKPIEHF
ncbi:MAG TPA: lysophospholipid acyltransferase family protein [Methylophilaceae bacterium]|nr:lysophospholipid acyltransferase family protein [Methylophilaceae bacterium]